MSPRPPRWAERLLEWRTPHALRPFLLGDLAERFEALALVSPRRARLWYARQALLALVTPLPGALGSGSALGWSTLRADVRFALRAMRRRPGQALVAVLTLGLGIGVVGAAFSILHGTVLRGLPFVEADRLVHFERSDLTEGVSSMAVTPHDYVTWRERQRSFEDLGAYVEALRLLPVEGAPPERLLGVRISASSFALLRVTPALGRPFSEPDERVGAPPVVLLSDRLWTQRFGADPDVVGRTVVLSDTPTTVVGVMPEGFGFPIAEQFWLPLPLDLARVERGTGRLDVFGRLRPAVELADARAEFRRISAAIASDHPATNAGIEASLGSFTVEYVGPDFVSTVWRLLLAALLVLVVCCANVANLLLIRGVHRRRALAVRLALGGTRAHLVRQLLTESALLSALGGALGLYVARLGVGWFRSAGTDAGVFALPHGPDSLFWWNVSLDAVGVGVVCALAAATALLAGIFPAVRATAMRGELGSSRSDGAVHGAGDLTRWLTAGQVTLTCALLVAAGFVARSVANVAATDDGFRSDGVLAARVDLPAGATGGFEERRDQLRFVEAFLDALRADASVAAVAMGTQLPLQSPQSHPFRLDTPDAPDASASPAGVVTVSPGYFDLFDVEAVEGRVFDDRDRGSAPPVALVNESFARRHLGGRALGRRLRLGPEDGSEPWVTVVGVVPDLWRFPGRPEREVGVYLPLAQSVLGEPAIRVGRWGLSRPVFAARGRGGEVPGAAVARRALYELDGSLPLTWTASMDELTAQAMGRYRVWGRFYLVFAGAALLLASLGVYGVVSFSVAARAGEIGVRRALGASAGSVRGYVLSAIVRPVGFAAVLGLLLGGSLSEGLAGVLYGVETRDPAVFVAVGLVIALTTLAASWVPLRDASRIEPVAAMRGS